MVNSGRVHSLTEFVRNSKSFAESIGNDKQPLGLTVNGKLKLVVVDAESYEELWEAQEEQRFVAAVREGIKDIEEGRHRPLEEVIREVRARYGL